MQCHGGNHRCLVSDKGPVLSVPERDLLRTKLSEFKDKLKMDKKEVLTVGGRTAAKRKRARSVAESAAYDEEPGKQCFCLAKTITYVSQFLFSSH